MGTNGNNGHRNGVAPVSDGVDLQNLLELFDGDADLLRDVVDVFLAHCPVLITELREAIVRGDAAGVEHAAHSLKGSVANFGRTPAVEAAYRLERIGADRRLDQVETAFAELQLSIVDLELGLRRLTPNL